MIDIRTLGEIATRTLTLRVACTRCGRHGRYRLDNLIARHGAAAGVGAIVPVLVGDCPRREAVALMERCDILFPELAALFPRT